MGNRKSGWVSTPDGKNVPFAPVEDTPPLDRDFEDSEMERIQNEKDHVPGAK